MTLITTTKTPVKYGHAMLAHAVIGFANDTRTYDQKHKAVAQLFATYDFEIRRDVNRDGGEIAEQLSLDL